jgi:hypothetical protein
MKQVAATVIVGSVILNKTVIVNLHVCLMTTIVAMVMAMVIAINNFMESVRNAHNVIQMMIVLRILVAVTMVLLVCKWSSIVPPMAVTRRANALIKNGTTRLVIGTKNVIPINAKTHNAKWLLVQINVICAMMA